MSIKLSFSPEKFGLGVSVVFSRDVKDNAIELEIEKSTFLSCDVCYTESTKKGVVDFSGMFKRAENAVSVIRQYQEELLLNFQRVLYTSLVNHVWGNNAGQIRSWDLKNFPN